MRKSRSALVWGLTLVVLGGLLLAQQQGLIQASLPFWTWVLGGLGVLFLLSALFNRSLWGMVIPGFICLGLSAIVVLSTNTSISGNVTGAIFLASIALPFWLIAVFRPSNWWAIIPAGSVTVLALIALLSEARLSGNVIGAILFFGLGATFVLVRLWTLGQKHTSWAWYPALILGAIGAIALASDIPAAWPLVFIGGGLILLIRALIASRPQTTKMDEPKG